MSERYASFTVPTDSSFEEPEGPDGPLIVHNVPLMVEGKWTSMQGKTIEFTAQDLQANFDNWVDNLVWVRHQLVPGENRPATESVGCVPVRYFNPDYETVLEDGTLYRGAAAMGDMVLHRQTEASRDAAKLIRLPRDQGGFRMVSSELTDIDAAYDEREKVFHPRRYAFAGLTIQRKGGCKACNIPAFAATPGQGNGNMADNEPPAQAPPAPGGAEGEPAWVARIEQKIDALIQHEKAEAAKGANAQPPAPQMAAPEPPKVDFAEYDKKLADANEEIRKLKAIVDKANSKPASLQTEGVAFSDNGAPKTNEGKPSLAFSQMGNNMRLRRRD